MVKIIVGLIFLLPLTGWAAICEVPKDKIDIHGLRLGSTIFALKKRYPMLTWNNPAYKDDKEGRAEFPIGLNTPPADEPFFGTVISGSNWVSFDKKLYTITGFNVVLDNFSAYGGDKIKDTMVILYNLPKSNWKYKKDYDGKFDYEKFTYDCKDYVIEIWSVPARESFMNIKQH